MEAVNRAKEKEDKDKVEIKEIVVKSYSWDCPGCKFNWIVKCDEGTPKPTQVTCGHCGKSFEVKAR